MQQEALRVLAAELDEEDAALIWFRDEDELAAALEVFGWDTEPLSTRTWDGLNSE